jgi:hypothetical protein
VLALRATAECHNLLDKGSLRETTSVKDSVPRPKIPRHAEPHALCARFRARRCAHYARAIPPFDSLRPGVNMGLPSWLGPENKNGKAMKIKSIKLVNAYGEEVRALQKKEITGTLGGKHAIMSFQVPVGYLTPKRIVQIDGVEPVYTDTFVMMHPWKAKAPGIDGYEGACRLNLKEAANTVLFGGHRLSNWIKWGEPLELRADRGWFSVLNERRDYKRQSLLDAALSSGVMIEASGILHHPHDKKFKLVKSLKTVKNSPVLQMTLWKYKDEWVAEIDMGHWKEVARNHLTAGKTHPYVVNQLLAWYWGVISFKLVTPTSQED